MKRQVREEGGGRIGLGAQAALPAKIGRSRRIGGNLPISVVVPVRNEAASLAKLVESLRCQTLQPTEIILVDGGSTDGTAKLARQLAGTDHRFQILEVGNATPGKGRNIGIGAATSDWIALTDAGIWLDPSWLEQLMAVAQRDPELDVVYGNYEPVTKTFCARCSVLAYVAPPQRRKGIPARAPFVASSLIRRSVWQAVGGFPDLRASEDLIFMERVEAHGFMVGWAPDAIVWWEIEPTWKATYKRFACYSEENVRAGRQRHWHHGVAKQYLAAILFGCLALVHSFWWLTVPIFGYMTRVAKSIWMRRGEQGLAYLLSPAYFLGVGVMILAIDLATFVGWARVLRHRMKNQSSSTAISSTNAIL